MGHPRKRLHGRIWIRIQSLFRHHGRLWQPMGWILWYGRPRQWGREHLHTAPSKAQPRATERNGQCGRGWPSGWRERQLRQYGCAASEQPTDPARIFWRQAWRCGTRGPAARCRGAQTEPQFLGEFALQLRFQHPDQAKQCARTLPGQGQRLPALPAAVIECPEQPSFRWWKPLRRWTQRTRRMNP